MFDNYIEAIIGGYNYSDGRKRALLLHCIGPEAQRVFNTLREDDEVFLERTEFLKAKKMLSKKYTTKIHEIAARVAFIKRQQLPVDDYILALRHLSLNGCNFRNENEAIRDQFVEKTSVHGIVEKLMGKSDLILDKTVDFARNIEQSRLDARMVDNTNSARQSYEVNAANFKPKSRSKSRPRPSRQHTPTPATKSTPGRHCYRCGFAAHLANSTQCRAIKETCRKCGKQGHYSHVCMGQSTVNHIDDVVFVLTLTSSTFNNSITCHLLINDIPTSLMVDTGSARTLIDKVMYYNTFSQFPLQLLLVR
ncbi:hypothetical protein SNE40_001071 [Patella caerulea]|uniref:CCHC-type domain-containing protein n=1 Tax=Patella caerulea TaxID=87958 RepID=A0AAN8KBT0_PATCE